mmetsp:Transcript_25465/g.64521  ORF Transcript_25465/g.64521 Transcript_25465/m.64521 type:complete len:349 (-) Transcript_25465:229-1275(-)
MTPPTMVGTGAAEEARRLSAESSFIICIARGATTSLAAPESVAVVAPPWRTPLRRHAARISAWNCCCTSRLSAVCSTVSSAISRTASLVFIESCSAISPASPSRLRRRSTRCSRPLPSSASAMAMPPSSPSAVSASPSVCSAAAFCTSAALRASAPSRPTRLEPRSRICRVALGLPAAASVAKASARPATPAGWTPLFQSTRHCRPALRRSAAPSTAAPASPRSLSRRSSEVRVWLPSSRRASTWALLTSRPFSPSRRLTSTLFSTRPSTSAPRPLDSTSAWSRCSSCSLQLGRARARPRGASADIEEGAKYERRDQRLLPERSRQSSDGDSASSPASALTPRPAILL